LTFLSPDRSSSVHGRTDRFGDPGCRLRSLRRLRKVQAQGRYEVGVPADRPAGPWRYASRSAHVPVLALPPTGSAARHGEGQCAARACDHLAGVIGRGSSGDVLAEDAVSGNRAATARRFPRARRSRPRRTRSPRPILASGRSNDGFGDVERGPARGRSSSLACSLSRSDTVSDHSLVKKQFARQGKPRGRD
jgi:hypothetical protein